MRFDNFVGNKEAKRILSAAVDNGRLAHALLIEGPQGSGRRTLARILARALVCSGTDHPCGSCSACIKSAAHAHPDITEVGGDGAARSFHIDVIRTIRENAYILPNEAPRRIVILAGAHNMTEQAQNALLKILEEPPAHLVFILTCESRTQMLSTIQSRTVCVSLGAVSEEEGLPMLRQLLPDTPEEELSRALAVYGGVIGQAVKGLQEGVFQRVNELAPQIAEAVTASTALDLLRLTAKLEKDKEAVAGVLGSLSLIFRDALCLRAGANVMLSISPETARKISAVLTREQLMRLMETVDGLKTALLYNMNHSLFLTLLCARLRTAAGR